MHPIAVDGSSVLSAFLSHHQPPSPTYRHQHTLVPSSPRPVTKEQLSVSHCDRMQLLSQKRCYRFSVDMTVARTYKPRLAITLFSFISLAEHTRPRASGEHTWVWKTTQQIRSAAADYSSTLL